jgi:hypothetical protein
MQKLNVRLKECRPRATASRNIQFVHFYHNADKQGQLKKLYQVAS